MTDIAKQSWTTVATARQKTLREATEEMLVAKKHYETALRQTQIVEEDMRAAQKRASLLAHWFIGGTVLAGAAALTFGVLVVWG